MVQKCTGRSGNERGKDSQNIFSRQHKKYPREFRDLGTFLACVPVNNNLRKRQTVMARSDLARFALVFCFSSMLLCAQAAPTKRCQKTSCGNDVMNVCVGDRAFATPWKEPSVLGKVARFVGRDVLLTTDQGTFRRIPIELVNPAVEKIEDINRIVNGEKGATIKTGDAVLAESDFEEYSIKKGDAGTVEETFFCDFAVVRFPEGRIPFRNDHITKK